jgi:hypothetical protein
MRGRLPIGTRRWFIQHRGHQLRRPKGRIVYVVRDLEYVCYPGSYSGWLVLLEKLEGAYDGQRWTRTSLSDARAMVDLGPAPVTMAELRRQTEHEPDGAVVQFRGRGLKIGRHVYDLP